MATRYEIVNGPSKFDLMMALFAKNVDNATIEFEFAGHINDFWKTPCTKFRKMTLVSLERNNIGGEVWYLKGYAFVNQKPDERRVASGVFSTKSRNGWLEITE